MAEQTKEQSMQEKTGKEQEIHYIPNPLPLPKKHVKKEFGFDFEPAPDMLEFDVELQEGQDDFDI